MRRDGYALFTPGRIGPIEITNRFVRSATADLAPWREGVYGPEDVALYRALAHGGAGLMVAGGMEVIPREACDAGSLLDWRFAYDDVRIAGIETLLRAIRDAAADCKVFAQLECNALISGDAPAGPSAISSPFFDGRFRELQAEEIERIIDAFAEAILRAREEGFDGVQLHAAHGGGLWHFLSPHANKRSDVYGGSARNRARIVRDIVSRARKTVGDFPITIKVNCTDYLEDGIDRQNFHAQAVSLEAAGVDAIEVSGGTWDSLLRGEEVLGFRPVPAAESHTGILDPAKQAYFLPYVEGLDLGIPLILVGGVRDVERAEQIVRSNTVQFVAMCRPLIREPDLVARWRDGRGPAEAACLACNACIYSMHVPFETLGRRTVTCLPKDAPALCSAAQQWLTTFVEDVRVG
jgi:2,4-dienoyl-CoA reductase-like NADH-dependent reductase (Old Yellow Enzyme family)